MLFGLTASEAFFVKCDAELNPPEVRDAGQLVIDVGLAPVKPAEFVIFRLSQIAGGGA
jgi:phage tail sheath protein FI